MTVAHPSVVTLRPAVRDRIRVPVPAVAARPVKTDEELRAQHVAQTRVGIIAWSTLVRGAIVIALLVGAYMFVATGMITTATDAFAGWFTGDVAPLIQLDFGSVVLGGESTAVQLGLLPGVPEGLRPIG